MASHPLRSAIDTVLASKRQTLVEFLSQRQAEGKSLRIIAEELHETTGIEVSFRTVGRWIEDYDLEAVS